MKDLSITFMVLLLVAAGVYGQASELSGRVTDPTGNVVPGAEITLTRQGTQTVQERATNETGYFFFPSVQPGTYEVRVAKGGFKTIQRSGVIIATADRARLDFQLELGSVSETLTVVGDASLLQLGSAEVSAVVTAREYDRLPQIQYNRMRSPANFLYLSPGVMGQITTTGRDNVSASNSIQINGSPKTSNELYLDGLPGRTNFNETSPPVDAIGEFKLQENQISAEYGNTGSAVVQFTLKTGTNELHGLVFDIFRNEKLDARSFTAPVRATIRQNEFGGTLGGPITLPKLYDGRNKSFFFFSYSGSRKRGLDQIQRLRVPTPENRAGDFSTLGRLIYDPATTRVVGAAYARDPFPANRIPSNRFDPVAVNVSKLLPELNLSGAGSLNYQTFIGEKLLDPDIYLWRIDHAFKSNHRTGGSFTMTRIPRNNISTAMSEPFSNQTMQFITSYMAHGTYDWVASPTLLNTALAGFNKFRNNFRSYWAGQGYAARFGLKGTAGDSMPTFSFTDGYAALGSNNSLYNNVEQSLILKDVLSWTRGRQMIKFGVEYRMFYDPRSERSSSAGTYSLSNTGTALPTNLNATGDSYASFLLGQIGSASLSHPFDSNSHKPYWSFFVQDDYRVKPRLTLNLGLRYEVVLAPYEMNDRYSLVDLGTPNPVAGNRPGASIFAGTGAGKTGTHTLAKTNWRGFGPRFGFAFQVNSKTVFRGGYGIYYGDNGIFAATTGYRTVVNYQTLDQGVTPPFILSQGFPATSGTQVQLVPNLLNGQSVTARSNSIANQPLTQNWSASVQRELGPNLALEVSYVANRNTRQSAANMLNINQVDPQYLALGSLLTQNITSTAARNANIAAPYAGFTGTVAQALRSYPQYLTVSEQSAKAGASMYNALVARIRKRYSSGVTLDAHYTWAKNIGNVDSSVQNDFNRRGEWTLLTSDVPHALVMQYSYELPFGPGKRLLKGTGVAKYFVGGWVFNGIQRYQSGVPLFVTMTNSLPVFNRQLRPNIVAGANPSTGISNGKFDPSVDRVVNRAAYVAPPAFTFGTAAPSYAALRNFPVVQEDFSLLKDTVIGEKTTIQFTAQVINAANRHRFADINSSFSSSTLGMSSGTNLGRIVTLGLKLKF